jgi:hypothetical protein
LFFHWPFFKALLPRNDTFKVARNAVQSFLYKTKSSTLTLAGGEETKSDDFIDFGMPHNTKTAWALMRVHSQRATLAFRRMRRISGRTPTLSITPDFKEKEVPLGQLSELSHVTAKLQTRKRVAVSEERCLLDMNDTSSRKQCTACRTDRPRESFSKRQWEEQGPCPVRCIDCVKAKRGDPKKLRKEEE